MTQGNFRNRILAQLSAPDLALIGPHLEPVMLARHQRLAIQNKVVSHLYFIEDGLASVLTVGAKRTAIEIGIVGSDGFIGLPVILGFDQARYDAIVQTPGSGYRIEADNIRRAIDESPKLHLLLLRFMRSFMQQVAETAASNGLGNIEQRLARRLLIARDRLPGDGIPVTHELLAMALGAQRPSVTIALSQFQKQQLIEIKRGMIVILDRQGLEAIAGECYDAPPAIVPQPVSAHSAYAGLAVS